MNKKYVSLKSVWTNPIHFLGFGCGLGLSPIMPGTVGSLLGIPLYFVLRDNLIVYSAALVILFLLGIYFCGQTAKDLDYHDHPGIVWDEVVGVLITYFYITPTWQWLLAGFLLFRLFDIWKPWPIKLIDRHVHGGFGIMIDDVLAAAFAWVALYLAKLYL